MSSPNRDSAGDETRPHRSGFVCLCGPTNAGKSTLMNAIVGQKIAITTPKPQTTRNRILGIHTLSAEGAEGGPGQIIFVDTPGLHRPQGKLSERMMEVAVRSLTETDVALLVVDAARDVKARGELSGANRAALERVLEAGVPAVVALNKVDRVTPKTALLPVMARYAELSGGAEVVPVSALKEDGLVALQSVLLDHLPEGPPLYPPEMLSDQAERFLASEVIREKVILATHQELPYSTAVEIEVWEEPAEEGKLLRIAAAIHVERESQKGIVIGKGGQLIKQIGTEARAELEEMFSTRIFLELFVHVEKNWTKDGRRLSRMGY